MNYIKNYESHHNSNFSKVLSDFGLNETQYKEIIDFIGNFGHGEVRNRLPFLLGKIVRCIMLVMMKCVKL